MTDFTQLTTLLAQIEGKIQDLCTESVEWRKSATSIKTYEEVVLAKEPRKPMADALDVHAQVCSRLSEISTNLIRVRTLRKSLGLGASMPPQLISQMQARIDRIIKDLEDGRASLTYLKETYDARLRFYNSCLYSMQ